MNTPIKQVNSSTMGKKAEMILGISNREAAPPMTHKAERGESKPTSGEAITLLIYSGPFSARQLPAIDL